MELGEKHLGANLCSFFRLKGLELPQISWWQSKMNTDFLEKLASTPFDCLILIHLIVNVTVNPMNELEGQVTVRLNQITGLLRVVHIFRRHTDYSIREIRTAALRQGTLTIGTLYGSDHQEVVNRIEEVLELLDRVHVQYDLIIEGNIESRRYLNNIVERRNQINEEIEMQTDLMSSKPDISTLEKLKERVSSDVFKAVLRQIIASDGYDVDEQTYVWVAQSWGEIDGS